LLLVDVRTGPIKKKKIKLTLIKINKSIRGIFHC